MDRAFIVAKQGVRGINPIVVIREVAPGSCAHTLSKSAAWAFANRAGQPLNVRGGVKHPTLNIHFTNLDGMTTDLGPASLDKPKDKPYTAPMTTTTPKFSFSDWAAQDERNDRVATFLRSKDQAEMTGFESSLYEQMLSKGRLSDKQRDCILRNLDKPAAPTAPAQEAPKTDVPAGHFAIDTEEGVKFYRVDRPTEGKWAGYTFVKVQASDDYYPVRDRGSRESILKAIGADVKAAMIRYGMELGKCGHCNRTLTDEESRAKGIGPVCEANLGW